MRQLCDRIRQMPENNRPRIIGLTGMLISGNVKPESVIRELESLENSFMATIATVKTMNEFNNVLLYSTNPVESIISYNDLPLNKTLACIEMYVNQLIDSILLWPVDNTHLKANALRLKGALTSPIKHLRSLFVDFNYQMSDMG